ncbi:hypothetical protein F0562_011558 [Nyssa sinensis]|uniref:Retrotransposon Copia-like N-terminal domain-containing protein n=1 Tax=Nyssa sinensis TaxID=561372 RepID=A0A5J4ZQA8_9ASTE|nr:hypothetical protein F0562_011558 [Nyssa sinensis]
MRLVTQFAVKNTNFGHFKYDNSTVTILYGGSPVGEAFIPRGRAKARQTRRFNVTVDISFEQLSGNPNLTNDINSGFLTLTSQARLSGKVELMKVIKKNKSGNMRLAPENPISILYDDSWSSAQVGCFSIIREVYNEAWLKDYVNFERVFFGGESACDPFNPFRIDNGDNPATALVSDLLTADNYVNWSRAVSRALQAKKKLGFINGIISKPQDATDPIFEAWEHCNDLVVSWLQNSDELAIYNPILVRDCGKLKVLNDRYDRDYVVQFLMGLSDSYSLSKDQIMLLEPLPPLNRVFSMIQQQERQHFMLTQPSNSDLMAMMAKTNPSSSKPAQKFHNSIAQKPNHSYCTHCKIQGHTLENCFKVGNATPHLCTHCNMSGHSVEKCYKLNGYPLGHKLHGKNKNFAAAAIATSRVCFADDHDEESSETRAFTKGQYNQLLGFVAF